MGCSTNSCSIKEKGCCVRGEVATGERALPERSTGVGAAGLIIDPNREQSGEFLGVVGGLKKKLRYCERFGRPRADRWRHRGEEEISKHVPPSYAYPKTLLYAYARTLLRPRPARFCFMLLMIKKKSAYMLCMSTVTIKDAHAWNSITPPRLSIICFWNLIFVYFLIDVTLK